MKNANVRHVEVGVKRKLARSDTRTTEQQGHSWQVMSFLTDSSGDPFLTKLFIDNQRKYKVQGRPTLKPKYITECLSTDN